MADSPEALRDRTKKFAVRILRLVQSLPRTDAARTLGRQLVRSGTAIGANYRAAGRGRSRAEFAAKMGVVLEEADETVYWLELLVEANIVPARRMAEIIQEANELVRVFAAARRTLKR